MASDTHVPAGPSGTPAELAPLAAGDPAAIGPYGIVGRLGSGGMGAAYGGVDAAGRCVIVTTINPDPGTGVAARELLGREVARLRGIDGVCVPRVRAAEPDGLNPWMATDFVAGNTLTEVVRNTGPLTDATLMCLAAGAAEALTAIHAAGIVHSAVTPDTVILAPEGPRLVGVGAPADQRDVPGWSAPELSMGGQPATAASDVFSWGATVAFAASGHAPFGTGDEAELRRRVTETEPNLTRIPTPLRDLVASALAKDPRSRPAPEEVLRVVLARLTGDSEQGAQSRTALKGALRGQLALNWADFDAAGHDPAAWARAATHGTAAPPEKEADQSGRKRTRRRPLRTLLIGTTVLVVLAALGAGGYVAFDRFGPAENANPAEPDDAQADGPQPREIVFEASESLLNADEFEAETQERPIEEDSDLDPRVVTHQFAQEPEPTFVAGVDAAEDEPSYVSTANGDLLEYDPDQEEWLRNPPEVGFSGDFPGPSPYTVEELIAPIQRMAEADDLQVHIEEPEGGLDTVVYTGSFEVQVPTGETGPDGTPVREPEITDFQIRVDENGHPVRSFYTRGEVEVRTEYLSIDSDVELAYPWDELPDDLDDIPDAEEDNGRDSGRTGDEGEEDEAEDQDADADTDADAEE